MSDPNLPDHTGSTTRLLECGRDPVEVVDRARAARSSTHEQTCPHCQGVIGADGAARTAARELVEAEREERVPTTMLSNIMRSVWSDLRRTTMVPLTTDDGSAFVADHTIAAVIESALDRLTDLQIHTCAAHLVIADADADADAGAGAESEVAVPAAATIAIEVAAAAAYNTDVRVVATEAREIVRRTVAEQFGWTAEPIDIDIVDVYVTESSDR